MADIYADDFGAWTLSRLGNAIDVYVDRTINNPQIVRDASQAYGVDANGNLYDLGQPRGVATTPIRATTALASNQNLLLLGMGIVIYLMVK